MAWIKSHQELYRHPKTEKAARLLDVSTVTVVGHLHVLWWWAMDYAPDGDLSDYDAADIAAFAGWTGDPDVFVGALIDAGPGKGAGFLDLEDDGTCALHDWDDFGGALHEKRERDAARKRQSRTSAPRLTSKDADVRGTSDGRGADVRETARVEERRGEESREELHVPPASEPVTADAVEDGFRIFWDAYRDVARGRPTGAGNRKPALSAWRRLSQSKRAAALEAVPIYGRLLSEQDAGRQQPMPAKHASTWLNAEAWADVEGQLRDVQATPRTVRAAQPPDVCGVCSQFLSNHDPDIHARSAA